MAVIKAAVWMVAIALAAANCAFAGRVLHEQPVSAPPAESPLPVPADPLPVPTDPPADTVASPVALPASGAAVSATGNANAGVVAGDHPVTTTFFMHDILGRSRPSGATLQNLLFGTTTVIDDELTEGHELGAAVVGRAQGFYVASSQDGTSKTLLLTAMFFHGAGEEEHAVGDTLSFFGVHRTAAPESHVAVIGGTGKYENAKGFAAIQTLHTGDQHTTDGVETLLQFSIHLI
uniref:Dirigent protein n=1 Tax=Leersia perrieri TaxID=77586 RepID=A0A0D9VSL7_9ORYZ